MSRSAVRGLLASQLILRRHTLAQWRCPELLEGWIDQKLLAGGLQGIGLQDIHLQRLGE